MEAVTQRKDLPHEVACRVRNQPAHGDGSHQGPTAVRTGQVKLSHIVQPKLWDQAIKELLRKPFRATGIDAMTVREFANLLQADGDRFRWEVRSGSYQWSPTRKTRIPKRDGGRRELSLPTIKDKFLLVVIEKVLGPYWETRFSDHSYGFRPDRNCRQAIEKAREYFRGGYQFVTEIDLERFFDRVRQGHVLKLLEPKVNTPLLKLLRDGLRAHCPTGIGLGQGSPLSPFLANVVLDQLDKRLEGRGSLFVRYADDITIFSRSEKAGNNVRHWVTKYLEKELHLPVNCDKTKTVHYTKCKILGFNFTEEMEPKPNPIAIRKLEEKILMLIGEGRDIRSLIKGWENYYLTPYNI